jgi:hypothetical protein
MILGETKKVSVCLVTVHSPVQFLAAVARLAVTRLAVVARLAAGCDDVAGGASDSGAGIRDDVVSGAIGAGVCDGAACGVCGIRAGTCDKVALVVIGGISTLGDPGSIGGLGNCGMSRLKFRQASAPAVC